MCHVTVRMLGDGRLEEIRVFRDNKDRQRLLDRLGQRIEGRNRRERGAAEVSQDASRQLTSSGLSDPNALNEFTFRFNRRTSASRGKLFYRLVQQAVSVEPAPFRVITKPQPIVYG